MVRTTHSRFAIALALAACHRDAPRAPSTVVARADASAIARDATTGGAPASARPRAVLLRALDGAEVTFAQPSRDGRRVAVGSLANAITVFDGADGTPLRRYVVSRLARTPPRWIDDATLEVSVHTDTSPVSVTLDLATGRIGPVIPRVAQAVGAATDGGLPECERAPFEDTPRRYRASGDWNGQVNVTDCETRERFVLGEFAENPAVTFGVMTGGVGDIAWSADGRSLAVPFAGVRVWDVARRTNRLISRTGVSAVWRPGARELTVVERRGADDERLVRLAANGDWRVEVSGWLSGRSRFAWSPDGARLAVAGQQGLWVYEAAGDAGARGAAQTFASAGDPSSLAWSDEGTLALSMSGGAVYVWRGGRVAWSLERAVSDVFGASVSPDGRWLLYQQMTSSLNEVIEVIWDLTRGRLAFAGALGPVRDGGLSWDRADLDGWTADSALRLRWDDGTVIAYHPERRTFDGDASPKVAQRDSAMRFVDGRGGVEVIRRDGARVRLDLLRVGSEMHGVVMAPDGSADTDDEGVSLLRALDGSGADPRDQGMLARFFAEPR